MVEKAARRRALCVRPRLNPQAAPVLMGFVDEWIHALALHCDVIAIEDDFDFQDVCEEVKPDFVIFDAVHWGRPMPLKISRADAHPHIPRVLFLNCDPHDPMRPLLYQRIESYRIDAIFCPGFEQLQHMPELSRLSCFIIPKFIDANVFRDYELDKIIPVSIFSGHLFPSFYPWRARITDEIQRIFPTFIYTHPGYAKSSDNIFEVRNEKYARLISQSYFSAADTSRLDFLVRKHLEIPAAGTVLVAPASDALKDYGFADLENCVLGSGPELYEKIRAVSNDQQLYERIRSQGHALVHAHYTRQTWTYILDWFECQARLRPGEAVQQIKPYGSFRVVKESPANPSVANYSIRQSPMSSTLQKARSAILSGDDLGQAISELNEVIGWIGHIAEPWFLIGVMALLFGDLDRAVLSLCRRPNGQGEVHPTLGQLDPCEAAWLLIVADLLEDDGLKQTILRQVEDVPHVSLRRTQWLLAPLEQSSSDTMNGLVGPLPGDCLSIHWLGQEDFSTWLNLVQRIFAANGKADRFNFMLQQHIDRGNSMIAALAEAG